MVDQLRSEGARRRREELAATLEPQGAEAVDADDTLLLLFLCCHPALSPTSAIALTLRAVGGLTTREIAAAFLVPEATMAQRISRAKRSIEEAGGRFQPPSGDDWRERASTPCSRCSTSSSTRAMRPAAALSFSAPSWRARRSGSRASCGACSRRTARSAACSR